MSSEPLSPSWRRNANLVISFGCGVLFCNVLWMVFYGVPFITVVLPVIMLLLFGSTLIIRLHKENLETTGRP